MDRSVMPEAAAGDRQAMELIVAAVPTAGSLDAISGWRGQELDEDLPAAPEWRLIGYDVCDAAGTSGLSNCGYEPGERAEAESFAAKLNERHLVSDLASADAFRQWCDRRVPEHAPFAVLALYARTAELAGDPPL
jgi:hypothetical protein